MGTAFIFIAMRSLVFNAKELTKLIMLPVIKRFNIKSCYGEPINVYPKAKSFRRYLFGGTIFGLGWALAGACSGPIFTLLGAGFSPILVVLLAAIVGALL